MFFWWNHHSICQFVCILNSTTAEPDYNGHPAKPKERMSQARSQDFSWGGGGGCVLKIKIQTCRGIRGNCSPRKFLETLKCLGLHFTRFHGGEREKDNVE